MFTFRGNSCFDIVEIHDEFSDKNRNLPDVRNRIAFYNEGNICDVGRCRYGGARLLLRSQPKRKNWSQDILAQQDFAGQLAHELSALEPQSVSFGWYSDLYQSTEANHKHPRQALELLAERGF